MGDRLQTERLPDGRRKLLVDLDVRVDEQTIFTIPAGTITDFSSIPWYARSFVEWSRVDIAGVVHDWLYQEGNIVDRKRADEVWRIVARQGQHCANAAQAWSGYYALRTFGWLVWREYRNE
jgi:hypothetical protein